MNDPDTNPRSAAARESGAGTAAEGAPAASEASARLAAMPARARPEAEPVDPVRARGAGRPLDENVDAAILETAWRLLLEEGYARMTIARGAEGARGGRAASRG